MNLLDILDKTCIKAPLDATDKKGVIEELVAVLAEAGKVAPSDADALCHAVWSREQTRTTGIGHGLAIPHGKSRVLRELVMAIGKPMTPIEFAAIDGKPVQFVVLLASPVDRTSDHIQALARISRLMTNESFRQRLYDANDADAVFALLKEAEEKQAPAAHNATA